MSPRMFVYMVPVLRMLALWQWIARWWFRATAVLYVAVTQRGWRPT